MAARVAQITLAGMDYTIHAFNIGELERVTDIVASSAVSPGKVPFTILRIALARAEPKIENVDGIEATPEEIAAAMNEVLKLAGLNQPAANPQAPADQLSQTPPAGG